MQTSNIFKICPMCAFVWPTRSSFLRDSSLELNGYQADLLEMENGLFYFTHKVDHCNSTMAVQVKTFFDLNPRKRYLKRMAGTERCPGYCQDKRKLEPCSEECECAFVRDIIEIIYGIKKEPRKLPV